MYIDLKCLLKRLRRDVITNCDNSPYYKRPQGVITNCDSSLNYKLRQGVNTIANQCDSSVLQIAATVVTKLRQYRVQRRLDRLNIVKPVTNKAGIFS